MTGIVDELERRLLPRLEEAAAALRVQHPQIKITTWSSPVGSLTEYQGHDVGIDCLCAEASADEGDNVALSVGVKHLTTIPKLCEAAVC